MNDDELNDSAVLYAVRDSICGLPTPTAPRLETITARGRAHQRRRVGALSIAGAGACAALVVAGLAVGGLAVGGGSAGPAPQARSAPQHHGSEIHLAAFSVVTDADGSTTLTLNSGQVVNPNAVRQALAAHGIPALVTANEFCRTADQPAPGVGAVVRLGSGQGGMVGSRHGGTGIVIYGSKIPSGVELSIGYRQNSQDREISFSLIQAGAPLSCTSIPDSGPHGGD
jgi:hypothetical protein